MKIESLESINIVEDIFVGGGGCSSIEASIKKGNMKLMEKSMKSDVANAGHSGDVDAIDNKCDSDEDDDDLGEYFVDVLPSPFEERKVIPFYEEPEMSDDEEEVDVTRDSVHAVYASVSRV